MAGLNAFVALACIKTVVVYVVQCMLYSVHVYICRCALLLVMEMLEKDVLRA